MNEKTILMVFSTCPDAETAARIGRVLVEESLAACVNVLPGARSIYAWQGAVQDETEAMMIIKTTTGRFPELRDRLEDALERTIALGGRPGPEPHREEADRVSRGVGLLAEVGLAAAADHPAGKLPYGHQRRLEIARALATQPRLLLLDLRRRLGQPDVLASPAQRIADVHVAALGLHIPTPDASAEDVIFRVGFVTQLPPDIIV